MEADLLEKGSTSPTPAQVFYSVFDPPETEPRTPSPTLLGPVPKRFDKAAFGPVVFTSKLQKKARNIGLTISRHFFLSATHFGYSRHENPAKIKKYAEIKGMKVRVDTGDGNSKVENGKYSITLFKSKVQSRVYTENKELAEAWRVNLSQYCVMTNYEDFYMVKEVLGKGAHGKVVLAENKMNRKNYAVKTFEKLQLITRLKGFDSILNEINILRKLKHGKIIQLHEVYESVSSIHLVLEYVEGGELYTRLKQKKSYSEYQCIKVLKNLLGALSYMHSQGIVHRDIKPENIVLASKEDDCDVKLVDFGFAVELSSVPDLKRCGTPGYVSPEVLSSRPDQPLSTKSDIFAVGALFYHMLTGSKLFSGNTVEEILRKNKVCNIDTFKLDAKRVSPSAKDLVLKMLVKNPKDRISAEEALEHPFMHNIPISTTDISDDNEDHSVGEVSKYSFDMTHLKELNMCSQSKVIDSAGTFHITSHIPLDRINDGGDDYNNRVHLPLAHHYSPHMNLESSPRSIYSHAMSNFTSESSFESLEESKVEEKSPRSAKLYRHHSTRNVKKSCGSNTPTASPIHRAAIMNNIKKSHLMEVRLPEPQQENGAGEEPTSFGGFSDFLKKLDNPNPKPKPGLDLLANLKRNSII